MSGYLVLCLIAVALAAPQGYNYQQQGLVSSGGISSGSSTLHGYSSSSGSQGLGFTSTGSGQGYFTSGGQSSGLTSANGGYSGYTSQQNQHHNAQQTIVSKRFFIHSAPEEHDDEYKERTITVGTPRKNYNVVFVKAPSKSTKGAKIRIIPAPNEEKTVIYVLNKKTEAADVHAEVQDVPQSNTKPEVFFIKYKTAEEAQHAQQQIQAQYDSLGGSTQLIDEGYAPVSSVIGSLNQGGHQTHSQGTGSSLHGAVTSSGYLPPNKK